jgi:hypothetical protein
MSTNNLATHIYIYLAYKYLVAKLYIQHMPPCFWYNVFIKNTISAPRDNVDYFP